jgi:hypothetical protein
VITVVELVAIVLPGLSPSWMFQALDMGSCLTTEVRSVPPEVVP